MITKMTIDLKVETMLNINKQVRDIMQTKGVSRRIKRVAITCVDPFYPAKSLGEGYEHIDVHYDKQHIQQAGPDFTQIFLAYNSASQLFEEIKQSEVHQSLPRGIVQLAFSSDTAVVGIPGDSYAFKMDGDGFAFGKPKGAPSSAAQAVVQAVVSHCSEKAVPELSIMAHPDCGLFANNVGVHSCAGLASHLLKGEGFVGSEYHREETSQKMNGAAALITNLHPEGRVTTIMPAYQKREPSIVKALKSMR